MTGQIADQFKYEGESYELVGIDGGNLYTAEDFGITTQAASTACWRGYRMSYNCKNGQLILDSMYARTEDKIVINDVSPTEDGEDGWSTFFNTFYNNLGLKTKFTGWILLGKDFIREMYVHMGFQSPESFKKVLELKVKDGEIITVIDLSSNMEERRKHGQEKPHRPPTLEDGHIENWIKDRFSQDYSSE